MKLTVWLAAASLVQGSLGQSEQLRLCDDRKSIVRQNANHIFNSVHSAMRQWGSSLNHNGVSFYLATMPRDTMLYHGRHDRGPVKGPDWLAFEPEHAMMFARPLMQAPGRKSSSSRPSGTQLDADEILAETPAEGGQRVLREPADPRQQEKRDDGTWTSRPPFTRGWLHRLRARRDLRFLYVDGTSAGKTDMGTTDSQDYVLLNMTGTPDFLWDFKRALELCRIIQEDWHHKLDGIIRMESGFEAIVCDIPAVLEPERVTEVQNLPTSEGAPDHGATLFTLLRAVAARYHGIGGNRVLVDYDSLVTGYSYELDDVESGQPRLRNASRAVQLQLRAEVTEMVLGSTALDATEKINWQAIADMVVDRYAAWLPYILSPAIASSSGSLLRELEHVLAPFMDREERNATAELARCSRHFMPPSLAGHHYPKPLAARSIAHVSKHICRAVVSSLYELYASADGHPDEQNQARIDTIQRFTDLVQWLQWPTWKECKGCGYNELCMVAMWPFGNVEDHERPSCLNASRVLGRHSYWGFEKAVWL